jgi:hypothetical protein
MGLSILNFICLLPCENGSYYLVILFTWSDNFFGSCMHIIDYRVITVVTRLVIGNSLFDPLLHV